MGLGITILTAVITSGAVSTIISWWLKSREVNEQRRWELKREACLEALEIVDARFADYRWGNGDKVEQVDSQDFVETARIRSCFNRLALACKDSRVPQLFETCLHLSVDGTQAQPLHMGTVVDMRNAIRRELGFRDACKPMLHGSNTLCGVSKRRSDPSPGLSGC